MSADPDSALRELNWIALKKAFGGYCVVGSAIALFVPERIAGNIPLVRPAVDLLAAYVPSIFRFVAISSFPETMRLFLLGMWLGFPIVSFLMARYWVLPERLYEATFIKKLKNFSLAILSVCGFGYFMIVFVDVSNVKELDHGGRGGLMMQTMVGTRIGLAIFGPLCFCTLATLSAITARLGSILFSKRANGSYDA